MQTPCLGWDLRHRMISSFCSSKNFARIALEGRVVHACSAWYHVGTVKEKNSTSTSRLKVVCIMVRRNLYWLFSLFKNSEMRFHQSYMFMAFLAMSDWGSQQSILKESWLAMS